MKKETLKNEKRELRAGETAKRSKEKKNYEQQQ